ncbi:Uu.00g076430.m01.CDS01 [Anthostomella pinea]|uniref:Uu.00g076430.m01.CDS01 n=1 Tax=Anthostomella pinea TaxID=933095 RepID=A0AAI8YP73_9PEZI|nr:Uu.00g076430.m01.CDS01 [Anthostomella pinea]
MLPRPLRGVLPILFLTREALAQSNAETVRSSFAYILYGERTPLRGNTAPSLTPLGGQQLYTQGSVFRARYLSNGSLSEDDSRVTTASPVIGLEENAIDNSQLSIYSSTDEYVFGSALAFMQGLYPPTPHAFAVDGEDLSMLANGTTVEYPLDGYQYPNVQTPSVLDPNSVWLEGHTSCADYWSSARDFDDEANTVRTYNSSFDFYQKT